MEELREIVALKNKLIHTITYNDVTSYVIHDSLYITGNLPIKARGLFEKNNSIVCRGYDKFFNVNEVPYTRWNHIINNTHGPYYMTKKENGCIIFISYDDSSDNGIRVTSKHSLTSKHAIHGLHWLNIHLINRGVSLESLSNRLKDMNATAICELCDDTFEEHVIHYSTNKSGLYLHGMVKNTDIFESYNISSVYDFSVEYGFHPIEWISCNNIFEVKEHCENYNGNPIEGWVIRTGNFFFKYKYNEPYLMWREWREITKKYLIHGISHIVEMKYPETINYSNWVKYTIVKDSLYFKNYLNNIGIIATRDRYYNEIQNNINIPNTERRLLIIPVGAPGVGKSTVCRILSKLLQGFIVENDCIYKYNKKYDHVYETYVEHAMIFNKVVIADRNNHLISQRVKLINMCANLYKNLDIWFISWDIPHNKDKIKLIQYNDILCSRIANRGNNHLNLTPSIIDFKEIVYRFLINRSPDINDITMGTDAINTLRANIYLSSTIESTMRLIEKQLPLHEWAIHNTIYSLKNYQYTFPVKKVCIQLCIKKEDIQIINIVNPDNFTKLIKDYHITLYYGNDDTLLYKYWKNIDYKIWNMKLESICFNDFIMAISVLQFDHKCDNPHITISMRPDVSPVMSNYMLKNNHEKIPLNVTINASGPNIVFI